MRERQVVRRFRAFLHAINRLMTRHDAPSEERRQALEGEAAQVGLELEETESKGHPEHERTTSDNRPHAHR